MSEVNKKLELRSKMAELHKAYLSAATELKELEEVEKKAVLRKEFSEYKHKVFIATTLPEEPVFEEVNDEDREHAKYSEKTAVVLSGGFNDGSYLLLKTKEDYNKVKLLYARIAAVKALEDKNSPDKSKYVKIILGEVDG